MRKRCVSKLAAVALATLGLPAMAADAVPGTKGRRKLQQEHPDAERHAVPQGVKSRVCCKFVGGMRYAFSRDAAQRIRPG